MNLMALCVAAVRPYQKTCKGGHLQAQRKLVYRTVRSKGRRRPHGFLFGETEKPAHALLVLLGPLRPRSYSDDAVDVPGITDAMRSICTAVFTGLVADARSARSVSQTRSGAFHSASSRG